MCQGYYDIDRTEEMYKVLKKEGLITEKEAKIIEYNINSKNLQNQSSITLYTKS
jgi:hypothetical protein